MADLSPPEPPPSAVGASASHRPESSRGRGLPVGLVAIMVALALLAGGLVGTLVGANISNDSERVDPGETEIATTSDEEFSADASDSTEVTGSTAVVPVVASDPASIFLSAPVAIPPGDPGVLSIVMTGPFFEGTLGGSVPVVVRNNTNETLGNIEVYGTARALDGSLAGSGSSRGLEPRTVQPGEWAMGYVMFSNSPPAGATFDLTVAGQNEVLDGGFLHVQLDITEAKLNQGQSGTAEVVGIASNGSDQAVSNGRVLLMCFVGGSPTSTEIAYTEGSGQVAPGGTTPFSVSLYNQDCPVFALGASG